MVNEFLFKKKKKIATTSVAAPTLSNYLYVRRAKQLGVLPIFKCRCLRGALTQQSKLI